MFFRNKRTEGICFAWTPKTVPGGTVWWEWVHFRWVDNGFGGWEYARWIPEREYMSGIRRVFLTNDTPHRHSFGGEADIVFTTPPDKSKCKNLRRDGPTPCHHPHCDCMKIDTLEEHHYRVGDISRTDREVKYK